MSLKSRTWSLFRPFLLGVFLITLGPMSNWHPRVRIEGEGQTKKNLLSRECSSKVGFGYQVAPLPSHHSLESIEKLFLNLKYYIQITINLPVLGK